MKALSVRQPWAWLIIHGGKTIDNRTQLWAYRGPVAIHAPARVDWDAFGDPRVPEPLAGCTRQHPGWRTGAIIGIAQLVDVHHETGGCCRPWGEPDAIHLVLSHARPIPAIPCRGRLGLWAPAPAILDQLSARTGDAATVWSPDAAPGGYVCSICGLPVESEPCPRHQPSAYAHTKAPAPKSGRTGHEVGT